MRATARQERLLGKTFVDFAQTSAVIKAPLIFERAEGLEWAIDGIMGALPVAERLGVQLVFENHSKPGV